MSVELFKSDDDALDLSTDAINKRAGIEVEGEADDQPADQQEEPSVEDESGDEPEPGGGDEVRQEDEQQPSFQMPDKFSGKTAEEIAQSYTELEKLVERKAEEKAAEMSKGDDEIVTNLQQQVQDLANYIQTQEQEKQTRHVTHDLVEQAQQGTVQATNAYNAALEQFKAGQVSADHVDLIVQTTRDVDDDLAYQMDAHWRNELIQHQVNQQVQPVQQYQQQTMLANALNQLIQKYPDIQQHEAQIAQTLQQVPGLVAEQTVEGIAAGVERAYILATNGQAQAAAVVEAQQKAAAAADEAKLTASKIDAQVETGSSDDREGDDLANMTEEEQIREKLFNPPEAEAIKKLFS